MTKHTPGPWIVDSGKPLMVLARDGGFAVILSEVGRKPTAADQANASLIATAPELLAALQSIITPDGKSWTNLGVGPGSTLAAAVRAINAATGEPNV